MTENEISNHVVMCAIEAHRTLGGPGLLESVLRLGVVALYCCVCMIAITA
jgi:hypothetical protein